VNRCPNTIRGDHRFEARYDTSAAKLSQLSSFRIDGIDAAGILRQMRDVTYVRDVCVRCGEVIERDGQAERPAQENTGEQQ